MLVHVDYPHYPGQLYDCSACELGPCTCDETTAPCVSMHCEYALDVTDDGSHAD